MQVITNSEVSSILRSEDVSPVMRKAFLEYANAGKMQERVRIDCGRTKLSMMGAIVPGLGVAGAKVYTTINGKFTFAIVLFSAEDGSLLATMEGDAMTEYRTAATTAVAADELAGKSAKTLGVIGTGIQARAHVRALMGIRDFNQVVIAGIENTEQFAEAIIAEHGVRCDVVTVNEAASVSDVLVTATRAATPLFDGNLVKPGAFVAAIGASKADCREVDDRLVRRVSHIVVEWKEQAKIEAGDLLRCDPSCFNWDDVIELSEIVAGSKVIERNSRDIILYKAIGVGLQDVALAEYIFRRVNGSSAGTSQV